MDDDLLKELEGLWDAFLKRWPKASLTTMTLSDYMSVGNKDTLSYWLEFGGTRRLGSIKGGDASKLGIYERKSKPKGERGFIKKDDRYSWKAEYGDSAEEAFNTIRDAIVKVADLAEQGRLDDIEAVQLEDVLKWKIAFLYQNREAPILLPIYKLSVLQELLGAEGKGQPRSVLYRKLMANRGDTPVISYGYQLWPDENERDTDDDTNELVDVEDVQPLRMDSNSKMIPLNQILFGPPGTGKTYHTINKALEILAPEYLAATSDRGLLKAKFDEFVDAGRIRFVTFHQSFSYEDFVEGIRAEVDEATKMPCFDVEDGVFKALCTSAVVKDIQHAPPISLEGRRIWKMSLGNTQGDDAGIYDECIKNNYVLLGYGANIDFKGCKTREDVRQCFAKAGYTPQNPSQDYSITSVTTFITRIRAGDLIVVSDGNLKFRAIAEVTGDYEYKKHEEYEGDYSQLRPVRWLRQYEPSLPYNEILNVKFSQMTLYELGQSVINKDKLASLLGSDSSSRAFHVGQRFGQDYVVTKVGKEQITLKKPNGNELPISLDILNVLKQAVLNKKITLSDIREKNSTKFLDDKRLEPFLINGYSSIYASLVEYLTTNDVQPDTAHDNKRVLIIDEINRGNISRIFGELITLIEPSKRAGAAEALSVILPYSKERFSVPNNVYLIGTMNTADRSLTGIDIALRRRFEFIEMPPRHELLDGVEVNEVEIDELLRAINERIEALIGADFRIGHAYFMPLKQNPSLALLGNIFEKQILPLLQEYFFDDWQRIAWVLNDHRKPVKYQFVQKNDDSTKRLFGDIAELTQSSSSWFINRAAFQQVESYQGIISSLGTTTGSNLGTEDNSTHSGSMYSKEEVPA